MVRKNKKGFTLVELLAVIVVLAIILVISVPKILDVIENARLKAYENSVNLMIHQAQLNYGSKGINEGNVSYPVSYIYGIDSNGETIQTNEKEVGLLNFKGDKPSEGTIIVDELGKVTVQNLVSKDRKFCAIKGPDQKNATVGKSNELNCIEEEEKEVVDKVPCELEIDKNDENVMYIDSVEDMYAFSDSVNNGNTYSGKTIKIRNDLDFKGYSEKKNVCGLASSFEPIGNKSHPFSGMVDGNIKYIKNLTIDKTGSDNVGIFGYTTSTASFVGLNLEKITVKGNNKVGSLVGYLSSKAQINEIVVKDVNVTGVKHIGGIVGYNYGQIKNAIVKSGKVEGTEGFVYGISGYYNGQNVTNSIVENVSTKNYRDAFSGPISYSSKDSYYSNKVTLNGVEKTDGLSESAISNINMYEYAGLDTYIGGDNTSTGYYFDYENDSSNNIVLKKAITNPDKVSLEGKGTKENPYLIKNMKDWKEVSRILNEEYYYKISNDIELSSGHFYMLGSSSNKFNGHVDGNLSRLYNLTLDIAPADNVGIFGYTTSTASFVGLNLENITVKGKTHVGSLVGYLSSKAQINEIVVKNVNVTGVKNIGGIVGYNYGQIKNAIVKSGKVEGTEDFVYGIAGYYNGQNVTNSIVENVSTKNNRDAFSGPISYSSKDSYYSNKVTLNGVQKTDGFDSNNIDNLSYYIGKVETINDGDKNNTGYYFDYVQSKNGIYLIKVK